MLELLKKFFKKEKEPASERINLENVEEWLKKFSPNFIDEKEEIKKIKAELGECLINLETVNIDEVKTEEKLKLMVKSNVPAYIMQVKSLLKKVDEESLSRYSSAISLCREMEASLGEFNKKTIRNFYIIQNLIGEELLAVTKKIKQIDLVMQKIKKKIGEQKGEMHEAGLETLKTIKTKIALKKDAKIKAEQLEKEIELLKEKREELASLLKKKEESVEFLELKKLIEDLELIKEEEDNVKNSLLELFAPLNRGFKKLDRIDSLSLLNAYSSSPIDALIKDEDMEIETILRSLKESIKKLGLKPEKQSRIVETINKLSQKNLQQYKNRVLELKKQHEETENRLKANLAEEEKKEIEREINRTENTIKNKEEEKEKMEMFNVEADVIFLEKQLTALAGHEVKLDAIVD
ncbi:hypothetical protein HY643_00960 [Candidatus Woesearchaeota archaeon]|nr:hypothetical protein [Candidatus Woesearchaeota archaeon]